MSFLPRRPHLAALALALAATVPASAAEEAGPIPVEAALAQVVPDWQAPIALSPDGRRAVLTVQDPRRLATGRGGRFAQFTPTGTPFHEAASDLVLVEGDTAARRTLTVGRGADWGASWSPDGRTLAFYSDRDGACRIWALDAASGEQRRVSDAIVRASYAFEVPRWTPDGAQVLVKLLPEGETLESAAARVAGERPARAADPAGAAPGVTARVYRSPALPAGATGADPVAWLEFKRGDLALVDVAGGAVDRIARGVRALGYWPSPDGGRVAYSDSAGVAAPGSDDTVYDIHVFARGDRTTRRVAARVPSQWGTNVAWSPDGARLAYGAHGGGNKGDCLVVAVAEGEPANLTAGVDQPFGERSPALGRGAIPPRWGGDGRALYTIARGHLWTIPIDGGPPRRVTPDGSPHLANILGRDRGMAWAVDSGRALVASFADAATKRAGFVRVDLASGRCAPLLERDQKLGEAVVAADGSRVAFLAEDAAQPPDLWAAGPDFRDPSRASHLNPSLEGYGHGQARLIEYRSLDGRPLRAALLLPPGHEDGRRHPLVVHLYPGEMESEGLHTYGLVGSGVDNLQLLATRGYAVLVVDTPVDRASVPADLLKMVMPGVERAVDLGFADPDRVGIMGHSFGGFGVASLITQTTRFRAAVASCGIGDLASMYGKLAVDGAAHGVGWAEDGQVQLGTPWANPLRYVAQSPVFHLDRVETPLLILGGSLDEATPAANMAEVFVGLRRLNKTATMVIYDGEEHGSWGFPNAVDSTNRTIAWFDAHIGPPAPTPAR